MKGMSIFLIGIAFVIGCGTNIYSSFVTEESDTAKMQEAANLIDDQKYSEAVSKLDSISRDNNEKRLLQVAAILGANGFDIWQIVVDIIDSNSSGKISFDRIFDAISGSVFGEGAERTARIDAIGQAISLLLTAPEGATRATQNLNCFLGGMLSVVAVTDGNQAITDINTALATIQSGVIGSGSNADECPGITELQSGLTNISSVQQNLSLVLQATDSCSFIDFSGSSLNSVEQSLNSFVTNGDQGCSTTPSCGGGDACNALSLGCVQSEVNDTSSVAGDGSVSSCEIVQNCLGSNCF